MQYRFLAASGLALGALAVAPAAAIDVRIDYTHDGFFEGNDLARAALEAAAADVSAAITTSLGATTDISTGTSGSTTVTFDFRYSYSNPLTGGTVSVENAALAADEVRVFVGLRNLTGPTLGQGGPGGVGFTSSASGFAHELADALAAAEAAGNLNVGRGGGPRIATLSDSLNAGGESYPYSLGFGSSLGNLWFDSDANDDGMSDLGGLDSSFWHLNHLTPVADGKFDLYSVAVHEILHALGAGTSQSWEDLVSSSDGLDWTGSEVIALLGSGDNVLDTDSSHFAEGLMSRSIVDLSPQEAALDPSILAGTRKYITEVDLAALRDMGWQTIVVPEPGAALAAVGLGLTLLRRRRGA